MRRLAALCTGSVLALAASGCMSTEADWRERYLEKERDASEASNRLSEERNAHAAAVAQLEGARGRISQLERDGQGRPGEAAMAPAATEASLTEDVKRMKAAGLDVRRTPDGDIGITLPADVTFGAGSKDLTPAGKKSLDQVRSELQSKFAGYPVRIEGHTDSDPIKKSGFKDNWELGSERALSAVRYLNSTGISPERLLSISRGDTMPVADNKSDKGKARNRRVEVIILVPHGQTMAK